MRITKFVLGVWGRLLAWTPDFFMIPATGALAWIPFYLIRSRRHILLENIERAFPSLEASQHYAKGLTSCRRTIEQGLLSIAWPFLSDKELLERFTVSEKAKELLMQGAKEKRPTLWLIPHFCHAETTALLPKLVPEMATVATLIRPLENRALNNLIKNSRERFGLKTFSRKDGGALKASRYLRDSKVCALLFDQNAGHAGTRMQFMGRECSCTTLPDILNKRFKPLILVVYTRRTGFWRCEIDAEILEVEPSQESAIEKGNHWLEEKLRTDENLCTSWLWLHRRWREGAGKPPRNLKHVNTS